MYIYIYVCVCVFSVCDPQRPSPAPAGRQRSSRQLQFLQPSGTKCDAEDQGAGLSSKKQA